jgi:hypothetical protein
MRQLGLKQISIILILGAIGWALCGAIVFIGRSLTDMQTTLITHAIGAPVIFTLISLLYFSRFNYTSPLQTAIAFFAIVVLLDFFLVALIIERSMDMFRSLLGTWIPWVVIFLSTYLTGISLERMERKPSPV